MYPIYSVLETDFLIEQSRDSVPAVLERNAASSPELSESLGRLEISYRVDVRIAPRMLFVQRLEEFQETGWRVRNVAVGARRNFL